MITTFVHCFLSEKILSLLSSKELPSNHGYVLTKKIILVIMGLQIIFYTICLAITSFYIPKIQIERTLFFFSISLLGVNSCIFLFSLVFFVWTLKYDLYFINLNLEIMPDLEYFVDFEEKRLGY